MFTACQKEEIVSPGSGRGQTITVNIPQGALTKATTTNFGDGSKVNRCILQVYRNGSAYGEQQVAEVKNNAATFQLRLVVSQTYDFVFWADCATGTTVDDFADNHYATADLTAVKVNGEYAGNDDDFDAFTGKLLDYKVTGAFAESVTLKRPFGQLNVKTLDLNTIPSDELKPTKVKVSFTGIPTTFNAQTGVVGTETAPVEYEADVLNKNTGELTVDYIWAPEEESVLSDFTMTFLNGDTEITQNDAFTSIPIRRNYKTNVSGNLLTKQGSFTVTVDPEFNKPDINDNPELRAAFANGGSVTLVEDVEINAPLVVAPGKTVTVDLNGKNIVNTTSLPDGEYGNTTVFEVKDGTLNLKGDGDIKAIGTKENEDGYRMAVYAHGNSVVNIYGGSYYNDQNFNNKNAQLDLIYADGSAEINIYGGRFESACANSRGYWVLNLKDNSNAEINVYGGVFVNFDPSSSMTENPVKNFVVEGSTTVKVSEEPAPNGLYEVVPKGEQTTLPIKVNKVEDLAAMLANPVVDLIQVTENIDLATAAEEAFTFTTHKTIEILENKTVKLPEDKFLKVEGGLTLTGGGTIDNSSATSTASLGEGYPKSLIHVTGGDLVLDGVTLINDMNYHWHGNSALGYPYNSAAIAYWNDANIIIKNSKIYSGEFTLCGMGQPSSVVTLTDSYFESSSSNIHNGKNWAYALRVRGSEVLVENCEVKGIQGGLSVEYCQDAVINGGKYYTVNTPGKTDAFYALYVTNGAVVTITGGEFIGVNNRSNLANGTSAVVSGDNDTNKPYGSIILKGGKFSGKAYNHVTSTIYEPAEGYQWKAIDNGGDLKWEVVTQ